MSLGADSAVHRVACRRPRGAFLLAFPTRPPSGRGTKSKDPILCSTSTPWPGLYPRRAGRSQCTQRCSTSPSCCTYWDRVSRCPKGRPLGDALCAATSAHSPTARPLDTRTLLGISHDQLLLERCATCFCLLERSALALPPGGGLLWSPLIRALQWRQLPHGCP